MCISVSNEQARNPVEAPIYTAVRLLIPKINTNANALINDFIEAA